MPRPAALWAFFRKDLEDALRSQTLLFVLVAPVLLSLFFVQSFGKKDFRPPRLAFHSERADSPLAAALSRRDSLRVELCQSEAQARKLVEDHKAVLAVLVSEDFEAALARDDYPILTLVTDPAQPARVAVARESLRGALRDMLEQEIPVDIRVNRWARVRTGRGLPCCRPGWSSRPSRDSWLLAPA